MMFQSHTHRLAPASAPASSTPPHLAPPSLRSFENVRDAVQTDSLGTWDAFALREALSLKDGNLAFLTDSGEEIRLQPTNWATGQLCARLGIPASYFRKCPPVLQDVQANFWLREGLNRRAASPVDEPAPDNNGSPSRWMLRAKGQTLRAVLSDKYSPLDNAELFDVLNPLMQSHYKVDWLSLADEGLHLRIVDPHRTRDVLPGDGLSVGIHIANSEVGFRSVTVDALVYRLVCTNGLIRLVQGKSLLRQRHVHIARPRLAAALEEAVAVAWNEAEGFIGQIQRTTQIPIEDVEGAIERMGQKWHLSQTVQDDVLAALRREPAAIQETVYGVVNAVTNTAQRQSSEARYDLEVLAGHLAEHGVAAFAPKSSRRFISVSARNAGVETEDEAAEVEPSRPVAFDAVETVREMFDAEIVSRHPLLPANQRELVAAQGRATWKEDA